jgi:glyoxylase-like metal-dependent hydrolase (beta-lactamase superfamily II)
MSEILPGVHQIPGVDPSPDFSTHVYLLKDRGGTWTLLDTGLPGAHEAILHYLTKIHVEPSAIRRILITHLHMDHTGSLRKMIEATKARTFAHWIEAAFIAGRPPYDGPGVPPKENVVIDELFKDGDTIDAAGGLTVFHTPGHTPGHTSYYQVERKLLFTGDLFFGDGPTKATLTPPDYTLHTPTAQISARRVSQLAIDSALTYHGGPILKDGGRALREVVEHF